ncbi:1-(5-phosphoribosyl)-5-[(5-phosphoribosylamino)methylideneamino]imidazole-4-carboxamide isomerase [Fodinisporobacter ferrooxydans]|uniref:1-(5-phosphoribosyl)-5-[(5-phosphoribosylamino)methylideneamino] imidazole-4-carboxamide isomerase n=1 Tax=Fodinisporobacter ferrooxydans TaxID=2901836 RepID=A0ABY4CQ29_9BACL|nr:1-(5-phosphoribosyl)-5-[(5-phosphoribosylamino)methylideneamino]imidazole-4-carboxamide isomerase [Alicyclobacillaceae bacterium MYW30-H2]
MGTEQREFILYPAIDIRDGKAVRLYKGDYAAMTVYHEDPAAVAAQWQEQGAAFIHVVDLDGAKDGKRKNRSVIEAVVQAVHVPVQVGGGIRTMETVESYFELGVERCILGTAAVQEPEFVKAALRRYGERIVIGLDAKDGMVAVNGWLETADVKAIDLGKELAAHGATRVVFTDIARDGTLTGPNTPAIVQMAKETGLQVIASGGVKSIDDLVELSTYADQGVAGAIIGKALYTGAIQLSEAIRSVMRA